jgi:8-oxo-dGTP diphosphatase
MTEKFKKSRAFTSGILVFDGKILILKRGPTAPTYPNMWDTLGGHLVERETAEECIIREAKEECGLDVRIKKAGRVFEYIDEYGRGIAIPYLLESDSNKVKLSFEHTEFKWIEPKEIKNYNCVPDLIEDYKIFGLIEWQKKKT